MIVQSIEEWITTVLVRSLGWTFTHSIWQALLALITAYVLLALLKKATPAARYNSLAAIFIMFICGVIATFVHELTESVSPGAAINAKSAVTSIFYPANYSATPVIAQSKRIIDVLFDYFNQQLDILVAVWFIIFSIKWLRLSLSLNYINRISKFECTSAKEPWQQLITQLKSKIGIARHVELMQSDIVKVPLVSGFLKPIILVPAGMLANMPADVIGSILLHELAHIRRSDYLVNMVQSALDTIFFFNPFILKLSALLRDEREACCDSIAVNTTNNKVSYVQALVAFGEYSTSASMLAFSGSKNHLLQRVKRILYNQNKKPGFMEKTFLLSSVLMVTVITAFTTIKNETKPATEFVHQINRVVTDTIPANANEQQPSAVTENSKTDKKLRETEEKLQMKQKELDEVQMKLENIQKKIDSEMKMKNEDLQKELKELKESKVDQKELAEIQQRYAAEADKAMKSIDMVKLNKEVAATLKSKEFMKSMLEATESARQLSKQQAEKDAVTQKLSATINDRFMNDDVAWILDFLEQNNVADAKDVKTFTLNDKELTVNGKRQPATLHQQLKEKFIKDKDDHIIYSNSGGNKSITIKRNDPN
jgi:bla regulator protein BlaR1